MEGRLPRHKVYKKWKADFPDIKFLEQIVSGYRIPTILTGRGERELELRIIADFLCSEVLL